MDVKVSDRVETIQESNWYGKGAQGIVVEERHDKNYVLVKFDKGDFVPCSDNIWAVGDEEIKLVDEDNSNE